MVQCLQALLPTPNLLIKVDCFLKLPKLAPPPIIANVDNNPDFSTGLPSGDDDDLILTAVGRVRLVQFTKDTEEPMGITLKVCF
ncbi:unnamed protein product [Meloidogyne enterolobii]|uniref:Uncharacterized protein n=1 Tax=Meloidogyne enterolobii TaxID=390850 RepID=A0ACB1AEA4_MELEN